ncbi:glycosyl hydrolase family 28-related protein [Pseudonocardia sp. NPDC049635]|uniref:glycosyl hydrolase family 28-related protein n=1 Tax=Pseudonocardia sp. NPDC049635 TaxID=3155506 RepID=UPI00340E2AA5
MADWYPLPGTLRGPEGPPGVVPGTVSVTEHGATGDGVTDDTAAIQAAIDTSPVGSVIWFPPGTYLVSETIRLAPYRAYLGAGGRAQLSVIRAASGLTGGAVLAAQGWWGSATACDNPIRMEGLMLDAASVPGTHGLVVFHFWSHFEDVQVGNVAGPAACGILATDLGRDGVTVTTNSHSENTFVRCRFLDHTDGATAFRAESNNGQSNQDGHLLDGFFAAIAGDGVRITRAAGWSIENNHFYGIGFNAIALQLCYATKVMRNYVEDFGGVNGANNDVAPTYGYFSGIALESVLDTRASIVALNTVSVLHPDEPEGYRWTAFYARAGAGQLLANVVFAGNTAVFANPTGPTTSRAWAYRFGEGDDTGRLLAVEWAGNQIQNVPWWQGTRLILDAVTITEPGGAAGMIDPSQLPAVLSEIRTGTVSVALTPNAARSAGGLISNIAVTGNPTLGAPTNPSDGQVLRYRFTAVGATRTLTFAPAILPTTGLDQSYEIPQGQTLVCALEYVGPRSAWLLTAATVG